MCQHARGEGKVGRSHGRVGEQLNQRKVVLQESTRVSGMEQGQRIRARLVGSGGWGGRDPLDIEDDHRHRARVDVEDATASSGGEAADAFGAITFSRT
ncbi:hypothetical protein PR202_gb15866 [Eleusine coracana subsp. coracana]|uniref:Uncharacterized protein n=1 Tax=Eleusine coracana subsp. coracana TaxID=191504 RepID=A0AAV5EZ12_ELECO|nr:hypothetical protein PR202_gb15866 [Eleusine coracana subsp. coracana]